MILAKYKQRKTKQNKTKTKTTTTKTTATKKKKKKKIQKIWVGHARKTVFSFLTAYVIEH